MRYAFIKQHRGVWSVSVMCRLLQLNPSGFYAWLAQPQSARTKANERLTGLIKQFWLESGGVYGYRKVHSDLREHGETCGDNRVHRLMKRAGLRAQVGYRRPGYRSGGQVGHVAENLLDRQFDVTEPDKVWVTDITYIRTHEGFLYLAVVLDLYSRRVIGWSMQSRMTSDLVLKALLMAVWRRKPKRCVLVHSDQGSQYTSLDWQAFLRANKLECSMSRRGNCHDNAVSESFFQLLKRERIKRRIYATRDDARAEIFDYIEMFYNPKRRHGFNDQMSPADYEEFHQKRLASI